MAGEEGAVMTNEELTLAFNAEKKIGLPFFGGAAVEPFFEDEDHLLYYEDTIRSFLTLSATDRAAATKHVWAYFKDFTADVGFDWVEEGMKSLTPESEEIWQFVYPTTFYAEESWDLFDRERLRKYIVLEGNCGWEAEHGILFSWRDGLELVKVSDYDGHATHGHAYNDLSKDAWIYHSVRPEMCTRNPLAVDAPLADEQKESSPGYSWISRIRGKLFGKSGK
jgi:hypothetical protein